MGGYGSDWEALPLSLLADARIQPPCKWGILLRKDLMDGIENFGVIWECLGEDGIFWEIMGGIGCGIG